MWTMTVCELRAEARRRGLRGYSKLRKAELIAFLAGDLVPAKPASPTVVSLRAECKSRGLRGYSRLRKSALLKLLDMAPPTDEQRIVAAIAALPTTLAETIASVKYMIRETTPTVEAIMKDRERRAVKNIRDAEPTEEGRLHWQSKLLAISGVVLQ